MCHTLCGGHALRHDRLRLPTHVAIQCVRDRIWERSGERCDHWPESLLPQCFNMFRERCDHWPHSMPKGDPNWSRRQVCCRPPCFFNRDDMKMLRCGTFVSNTGHLDNEFNLAGSEGLEGMKVDSIKPLPRWSQCNHAGRVNWGRTTKTASHNPSLLPSVFWDFGSLYLWALRRHSHQPPLLSIALGEHFPPPSILDGFGCGGMAVCTPRPGIAAPACS